MNTDKAAALFADDMWGIEHTHLTDEEKAILTADYTPADRNEGALPAAQHWPARRAFVPQGCDQQGRYTPTIQPAPAEACTEIGAEPEDPTESADLVLLAYFAAVLLAMFTAWCIANYLAASSV
jgi:hypothetical protein